MAPRDDRRQPELAHAVAAVITHVSGRVLAIQRVDEDAWRLPGGPIAPGEPVDVRLRQYVRAATGFEIRHLTSTGNRPGGGGAVEFIRCEISGVGADITSRTRTMRWMDRATIVALVDAVTARGMLDALDARDDASTTVACADAPTLLAS
jgi:hypothetical protein